MRSRFLATALVVLLVPVAAGAQNREHLQMNADIRMLQEHVSRLQLAVNRVTEQLEAANKRIDDASATTVKGFADQQLVINQLSSAVQTIRERLDDNTVRVSQLSQEFVAIREGLRLLTDQINTLVGLLQPAAARPADGAAVTPGASAQGEPVPPGGGPLAPVVMPPSASRIYESARGDFMSDRYDSAIEGFREIIQMYPDSPTAADAQFQIGESFYYKDDCKAAIAEYQKFFDTYPAHRDRADALFMIGACYGKLKQTANERRTFERVLKEFPDSVAAMQAKQRLSRQ